MPRMRDMVICVKIIQLMTNSTRGIFLMTWTINVLLRHYIASHFNQISDDFQWWWWW
jgi:hypothetical protein